MHGLCDLCGQPSSLTCGWCRMAFCVAHHTDHVGSDYHKRASAPISLSLLAEIEAVLEGAGVEPVDPDMPGRPKDWCIEHNREGMVLVWGNGTHELRPCPCRYIKERGEYEA